MTSIIETIKAKVDVAEEIGLVVALQKSGKSLKGLCPFHNERTPSFYVFPESQTWRCFGCNEGGDVFSFVQKQQGLEFRETLHYLAEKAGVSVEDGPERNTEEERERSAAKERLRKLNEDALLWFHQMLLRSKEAADARAYVQSRGISSDTVIAFSIGYAPERWDGLTSYLLSQGYTARELIEGGLARAHEEQEGSSRGDTGHSQATGAVHVYDYFRNRIIFPIRDMCGRVIGFGGRALGDSKPKYLNSPQTLLFEKNTVLYAIDMARDAIKQAGQVVIVEGYVDAVIAHQYGTKQTVACIGSAITEKHIQQLKKLTKQVTLALDPDAAGSAATEHGIQEALKGFDRMVVPVPVAPDNGSKGTGKQGTYKGNRQPQSIIRLEEQVDAEINVLQLPEGEDPDEVIRRDFSSWFYAVSHPLPLVDYYFVVKTAGLDVREPVGKTEAAKRLLPIIATIRDRIKRDAYVRKLATIISVDERLLYEALQQTLREQKTSGVTATFSDTRGPSVGAKFIASPLVSASDSASANEDAKPAKGPEQRSEFRLDRSKQDRIQWEDYLIGLLLQNPGLSLHVCAIITDGDFAGTDTRELYRILSALEQRDPSPSHQSIEDHVPSALHSAVSRAKKCAESRYPKDGAGLVKEAVQCATRLKKTRLLQLNTELYYLIREASASGDYAAIRGLQPRLMEIHQQLRTLNLALPLHG